MYDAIFLNGSVGVGKTTVAEAVADALAERGFVSAFIDVDALRRRRPSLPEDPWQNELALSNLRSVAANYRADGVRVIVTAGVIESAVEIPRYADALGASRALFVRLIADPALVAERLHRRHEDDPDGLRWHLARHPELDAALDDAAIPHDLVLDTGLLSPAEVTERITERATS
ncbi:hypothetical protein GCM10027568_04480 [Humibacter soli]